jgi:hypothetical protein
MKRRYQIEKRRAVNEFRQVATEQNPTVQMMLPMAEILGLVAARSRAPAEGSRIGFDEPGDGGGSAPSGR